MVPPLRRRAAAGNAWQAWRRESLNDAFHAYQVQHLHAIFGDLPQYDRLMRHAANSAQLMLEQAGVLDVVIDDARIFCWSSVLAADLPGAKHTPHTHGGGAGSGQSAVSTVFFARTPPPGTFQGGELTFHDPRGSRWPFDNSMQVSPVTGTMVAFPSWLVHGVEGVFVSTSPTGQANTPDSSHERVTFNCNVPLIGGGGWRASADVNLGFPLS